jgi:hypothetical protein
MWFKIFIVNEQKFFGSVSFIADVVMLNISLFEFPLNHPYSKFFLKKVIKYIFLLTSNFIISLSESP